MTKNTGEVQISPTKAPIASKVRFTPLSQAVIPSLGFMLSDSLVILLFSFIMHNPRCIHILHTSITTSSRDDESGGVLFGCFFTQFYTINASMLWFIVKLSKKILNSFNKTTFAKNRAKLRKKFHLCRFILKE